MSRLHLPWDKPRAPITFDDSLGPRFAQGTVTWRKLCKKTGEILSEETFKNLVTFQADQIMAKALVGSPGFKITHIYGEHADPGVSGYIQGSLNGLVAARSDTVATMRTFPRDTVGAEEPVLTTAFGTTTEILMVPTTDYDQNMVTVTAIFSDPSLVGRIFVGAGLVTQVLGTELVFAHSYRPALTLLITFDLQVAWTIRFL
jgi:hypothetical protein